MTPHMKTPGAEDTRRGPNQDQPTKANPVKQNIAEKTTPANQIPPLLVAECKPDRILAKRFLADGTKVDFSAGLLFKYHELLADTWPDLLECLTALTHAEKMCVLRGALDPEFPRDDQGAPADQWYHRRKHDRPDDPACIQPAAFPWVVYDYDDTIAPFDIEAPEQSIRAWHSTLAPELRAAQSAFFISGSAHTSATIRGKLVVWYLAPVGEAQSRALAGYYHADRSVGVCSQANYFAAPVFAAGAVDPLEAHRHSPILFEGKPARMPNRAAVAAFKAREAPVLLKDCPPGDQGILAALGPAAQQVGKRFHIAGHLGGIMRKLNFPREACGAILTEWIPAKELAPRLKWAVEAWDKPADVVSGEVALRDEVGRAHADVIVAACMRARRPVRVVIK